MSEHDSTLTPRSADVCGKCKCGAMFTRRPGSKHPKLCTSCDLRKQGLDKLARPERLSETEVLTFLRRKS